MKKGWGIKTLGEICEVLDSKRVPITKRDRIAGPYPYYGATGVQDYVHDYIFDEKLVLIGEDGAKWESGENTAFIVEGKYWVNNHAHVIRPNRSIVLDEWLVYYLNVTDLMKFVTGLTVPKLNQEKMRSIPIPIPPLPEQQRIVALLDETFAALTKVHANAERNQVNAREVFDSVSNEEFNYARKGWKEMTLDDTCIVERGSSPRPIKKYQTTSKDGVNWVKIGDTKDVEKYIYTTKEKITKEGAEKSRFVKEDDLILTNSMSYGYPYIMKTEGYIHDGWFVLRLKDFIDTEFFWYLLASPFVQNQFKDLASGAIVKNISSDLVKKAILFIPPLAEQRAIVHRLDALAQETRRLEEVYRSKVEAVEELRKSVLQKAFSGDL